MTAAYLFEEVETDQLVFDPENPRLPPDVDGRDNEEVMLWMLADTGLLQLMASIARQGYFPGDPLLIAPLEETSDEPTYSNDLTYKVVEGNRRLAAVKLVTGRIDAPRRRKSVEQLVEDAEGQRLDTLPAVVFARRDDVLEYLGFRHITGIKQWDPLEKARFLRQLRERSTKDGRTPSNTELARAIGSTGPYVGRLLAALTALERLSASKALAKAKVSIDDVPFSLLVAALNHEPIVKTFLQLDRADDPELRGIRSTALNKLGKWLFVERENGRTALEDSRNLGLLDDIVGSKTAIKAFDDGMSIHDAALLAHGPADVLLAALGEARGPLTIANDQADELEEATQAVIASSDEVRDIATEVADKVHQRASE